MSGSLSMVRTASAVVRRQRGYLARGHADRIDACRDPVARALRFGCAGLTVGVRVGPGGRLQVATARPTRANPTRAASTRPEPTRADPTRFDPTCADPGRAVSPVVADPTRALSRLVLDPLHARVRAGGRLCWARRQPFTLVLEPADDRTAPADVLDVLDDELAGYVGMLTRCAAGSVESGPVLVVLSGAPRERLARHRTRLYFGEGTLADVGRRVPTSSLPLVGEHVAWRFGWDGCGEIPPEERYLLTTLVRQAHAEGKRVRFFGVPERRRAIRRAFWRELHGAGADLVGAHDVAALRRLLRSRRAHR